MKTARSAPTARSRPSCSAGSTATNRRAVIEAQDREISAKSGMTPLRIKNIVRADAKDKTREGMKEWKLAR
jgi:hypothetical protein